MAYHSGRDRLTESKKELVEVVLTKPRRMGKDGVIIEPEPTKEELSGHEKINIANQQEANIWCLLLSEKGDEFKPPFDLASSSLQEKKYHIYRCLKGNTIGPRSKFRVIHRINIRRQLTCPVGVN